MELQIGTKTEKAVQVMVFWDMTPQDTHPDECYLNLQRWENPKSCTKKLHLHLFTIYI